LVSIGTLRLVFSVDRSGRVTNLKIVENTSNESFANVMPAICPRNAVATDSRRRGELAPAEGLDEEMSFTMYAQLMSAVTIIAEAPGTVQTIMSFFIKGGLFMWPLLACSIVAVTNNHFARHRLARKKM